MKLTEKECREALSELEGLEIYDDDSDGNICYENHSKIKDLYSFYTLEQLTKEYFELKDSEHANKMIVRNLCEHFGVNSTEELQNIYLNKPYKFMDLKKGLCVWDKKEKEYIPIIVILSKKDCEYRYHDKNKQVFISWQAIEFEEDRFYPREVKENE